MPSLDCLLRYWTCNPWNNLYTYAVEFVCAGYVQCESGLNLLARFRHVRQVCVSVWSASVALRRSPRAAPRPRRPRPGEELTGSPADQAPPSRGGAHGQPRGPGAPVPGRSSRAAPRPRRPRPGEELTGSPGASRRRAVFHHCTAWVGLIRPSPHQIPRRHRVQSLRDKFRISARCSASCLCRLVHDTVSRVNTLDPLSRLNVKIQTGCVNIACFCVDMKATAAHTAVIEPDLSDHCVMSRRTHSLHKAFSPQ